MEPLSDFPKIQCPFIRQTFSIERDQYKKAGKKFGLRAPEVYLIVDRVNPGYEWVFDDPETIAVEKLDGTNIKIKTENGRLTALQNRKNVIDPLDIMGGRGHIIEGIFRAIDRGYVNRDGEQAGELIGPKLQANPYRLDYHLWYPFMKSLSSLRYKSFHEHDRNFDNWSSWFKDFLFSLFFTKSSKKKSDEKIFAEGVVFYNMKRRSEGKVYMAKLRRDMFDWYYEGIDIIGYDKRGKDAEEDQDKFD